MIASDTLTQPWEALVAMARSGLARADVESLQQVDAAFQYRFVNEVHGGTPASQEAFIEHMLSVTESPEARALEEPPEPQRLLSVWEHLALLMESLRDDGDLIDDAARLLESRAHAEALLEAVAAATGWGIQAGVLAKQLGISAQHLAALLRDLQPHDIITRRKVGKYVYVCPGLVGDLLLERRSQTQPRLVASTVPAPQRQAPNFAASSPAYASLKNPRQVLVFDAV